MNLRLLMDGIVRQTTVLLAQLSTTAGVRSPLAHIADQVFVELAREIEVRHQQDIDSVANLAWLLIFRGEVTGPAELSARLQVEEAVAKSALDELLRSARQSYSTPRACALR